MELKDQEGVEAEYGQTVLKGVIGVDGEIETEVKEEMEPKEGVEMKATEDHLHKDIDNIVNKSVQNIKNSKFYRWKRKKEHPGELIWPKTSYQLFREAIWKHAILSNNPDTPKHMIEIYVNRLWKLLPDKSIWEEKSNGEYERYKSECKEWLKEGGTEANKFCKGFQAIVKSVSFDINETVEDSIDNIKSRQRQRWKKGEELPGEPIWPKSGFGLYMEVFGKNKVLTENPHAEDGEIGNKGGRYWKRLVDKSPWEKESIREFERYETECRKWLKTGGVQVLNFVKHQARLRKVREKNKNRSKGKSKIEVENNMKKKLDGTNVLIGGGIIENEIILDENKKVVSDVAIGGGIIEANKEKIEVTDIYKMEIEPEMTEYGEGESKKKRRERNKAYRKRVKRLKQKEREDKKLLYPSVCSNNTRNRNIEHLSSTASAGSTAVQINKSFVGSQREKCETYAKDRQLITNIKKSMREWTRERKIEKIASYSSCIGNSMCGCIGFKPLSNQLNIETQQRPAALSDSCRSCSHSFGHHISNLSPVSEDELDRLLGMVVDAENLKIIFFKTSSNRKSERETKTAYWALFKMLRKSIRDMSSPSFINLPFGNPPFQTPTIAKGIRDFWCENYQRLPLKEGKKMADFVKRFETTVNLILLDTPTELSQEMGEDILGYRQMYMTWFCCSLIPTFCDSIPCHNPSKIFGRDFLEIMFPKLRELTMDRIHLQEKKIPLEDDSSNLDKFSHFLSSLEKEIHNDQSPIWNTNYNQISVSHQITNESNRKLVCPQLKEAPVHTMVRFPTDDDIQMGEMEGGDVERDKEEIVVDVTTGQGKEENRRVEIEMEERDGNRSRGEEGGECLDNQTSVSQANTDESNQNPTCPQLKEVPVPTMVRSPADDDLQIGTTEGEDEELEEEEVAMNVMRGEGERVDRGDEVEMEERDGNRSQGEGGGQCINNGGIPISVPSTFGGLKKGFLF